MDRIEYDGDEFLVIARDRDDGLHVQIVEPIAPPAARETLRAHGGGGAVRAHKAGQRAYLAALSEYFDGLP